MLRPYRFASATITPFTILPNGGGIGKFDID
jgi:hypothetical protein